MSTNLTRRSLFARTAAVAVVAAAPAALAMPEEQQPVVAEAPAPIGPTQIDRLWKQRQDAIREDARLEKRMAELEAEVDRQMPAPHPSILYSPEQEADGLKWPVEGRPPSDKFIWPLYIEGALDRVNCDYDGIVTVGVAEAIEKVAGGLPKLSADKEALRDRLVARLKLSKQYMRKWRRVQAKAGVTALYEKMDAATSYQGDLEERISRAKPVTRADMARKLALYDHYKREFYGEEIIRDMRKLFAGKITLAA
jgi:hypothetical protein